MSDRITLSWEPPFANNSLRSSIQDQAQQSWFSILIDFCHDPSSQRTEMQHRLSPDPAEVIEVFGEFGGETLYEVLRGLKAPGSYISDLCIWLSIRVCRRSDSYTWFVLLIGGLFTGAVHTEPTDDFQKLQSYRT